MRVGAGKFRGLKLSTFGARGSVDGIRPTSSKIRAAIFDMLMHGIGEDAVAGARVLDLFAGTGAMGLEAISRGAAFALFVDSSRSAIQLIQRNIRLAKAESAALALAADAARLSTNRHSPFDLAFVDAPYGSGLASAALKSAIDGGWIASAGVVAVESPEDFDIPPSLKILKRRGYRQAKVTILGKDP